MTRKIDFSIFNPEVDLDLRDYQNTNKDLIYKRWAECDSVMLQMPTGTGKTRLFVSIAKDLKNWGDKNKQDVKILFLVHRKELIDQISNNLSKYKMSHGFIVSKNEEQQHMHVQVGSVPTLNRRLDKWGNNNFDVIIVDEAHHVLASSYRNILNEYPNAKVLGVTATPYRLSKEGFTSVFDKLIVSQSIPQFIENKWLCEYDYYSIEVNSNMHKNITNLKLGIDGDYLMSDMERTLDKDSIRAKIVDTYINHAKGKRGIVYTISQAHNKHICDQFIINGISAKAIDSETSKEERNQIINDFRNGKFDILCNVNILSEGFDCPDVEFIQLARPTKSLSMYLQQVGRGFRTSEGKEKVIFLDNVGLYNRFGLPSARRNWMAYFMGNHGVAEKVPISVLTRGKDKDRINIISEGDDIVDLIFSTEKVDNSINKELYDKIKEKNQNEFQGGKMYEKEFKIFLKNIKSGELVFSQIDPNAMMGPQNVCRTLRSISQKILCTLDEKDIDIYKRVRGMHKKKMKVLILYSLFAKYMNKKA